ncbi:MAG: N-acetylglucosamine-6-phosphate deacetylase [Candidatus Atribacteria bacterium]|nr:N-acetylglucosamine-6-phosphate deacetylase [Candidatus Atribacteria bacterium]
MRWGIKGHIVTPLGVTPGLVVVRENHIEDVLPYSENEDLEVVYDFKDNFIFPGLVDLHLHGLQGEDVTEGGVNSIQKISTLLPSFGVTSFLPTTLTTDLTALFKIMEETKSRIITSPPGARVLGLHLEGPYLSLGRKGAHDPTYLRKPHQEEIKHLFQKGEGVIKRITIAPELPEALETIEYLAHQNILVSLGHSEADYETSRKAGEKGAKMVTHLFNGMDPLHHRQPNLLAFALGDDEIYAEIIADKIHVKPEIMKIALKCKAPDRLCIVSDALKVTNLPEGIYDLSGQKVEVKGGMAYLPSGTLAGSTFLLHQMLYNLKELFSIPLPQLAKMGSFIPAQLVGKEKELGSIEKGKIADIVVFDDCFQVKATFIGGVKVRG